MRVKAGISRDDASAKRRLLDAAVASLLPPPMAGATTRVTTARASIASSKGAVIAATMTTTMTPATKDDLATSRFNYSSSGGRSKLQLECSDGRVFDVTHEEAMMSSTLWMLLQDVADNKVKTMVKQHMIPIYDVPSNSVELALFYCRCLYKQQVEGHETALHAWDDRFVQLDSKTLCDLAKVASHLDIQPLVDLTCRSIAQIMSGTDAAHEIRQKFGLDDLPSSVECSCELRSGMSGFDFDMFNSLDHDLSTDEYELVEFDQPSVDELVSFINGSSSSTQTTTATATRSASAPAAKTNAGRRDCHLHTTAATTTVAALDNRHVDSANKKKNKKKKKKKKATAPTTTTSSSSSDATPVTQVEPVRASSSSNALLKQQQPQAPHDNAKSSSDRLAPNLDDDPDDGDENASDDASDATDSSDDAALPMAPSSRTPMTTMTTTTLPQDLQAKMRLAQLNPSAIFCESQFDDEDKDDEMHATIETFRQALESAHMASSTRVQPKPRVEFAPQNVFRSTLVQRVSTAM